MIELKSFALSLCVTILLFSMVKSILPSERYEKYLKMIISFIFMVLLFTGLKGIAQENKLFDNISYQTASHDISDALNQQIMNYINAELKNLNYQNTLCISVNLSENNGNYTISKIYLETKDADIRKLKKDVSDITGIKEGSIYVN